MDAFQNSNMTNSPKISVIIPTFNGRDSIKRSVTSVLNQHFKNLEVVVVDDNPVDSKQRLSGILGADPRVRVVRNTGNHGPSQARNFGVKSARGELVTFLDDDDCYLEGRLQSLLTFYESSDGRYSFISSGRFAEVGDFFKIELIPSQKFGLITLNDIYSGNNIDIGLLMKVEFFQALGGFDENLRSLEDWDLVIRALKIRDGFKVQRFDYVVNRTEGRYRVSEREMSGYFDIADKYAPEFGGKWASLLRAKGLSLTDRFSLAKALSYSYRASSLRPLKLYLWPRFPSFIRRAKEILTKPSIP